MALSRLSCVRSAAVLLVLLFASQVATQEPERTPLPKFLLAQAPVTPTVPPKVAQIDVDAPAEAPAGVLVFLKVKANGASHVKVRARLSLDEEVTVVQVKDPEDTYVFTGRAGDYLIEVYGSTADGLVSTSARVRIGEPKPPPPDPPDPPTPPLPPDLKGFAKIAYDATAFLNPAEKPQATRFASNFESVAAQMSAGTIADVTQSLAVLRDLNRNASTPEQRTLWLPFFSKWKEATDDAWKKGEIKTPEDYARTYRETAEGLNARAKSK